MFRGGTQLSAHFLLKSNRNYAARPHKRAKRGLPGPPGVAESRGLRPPAP